MPVEQAPGASSESQPLNCGAAGGGGGERGGRWVVVAIYFSEMTRQHLSSKSSTLNNNPKNKIYDEIFMSKCR